MNALLFGLSFALFIIGLVGVARGQIDRKICRTRTTSLIPLLLGLVLMFTTSAPPLNAAGTIGNIVSPPPPALRVLENLEPVITRGTRPAEDLQPEQQEAYPKWERQLLAAHEKADKVLEQATAVLAALDRGSIDRFTAWTHLSILSQDLKQAKLGLHDLIPPSVLNLVDQKSLEAGLDDLRMSLRQKRNAILTWRDFVRSEDITYIERGQDAMDRGHDMMVAGLSKLARVKARLDLGSSG